MPITFQFETGQTAPSSGPPRRYVRKAKGSSTKAAVKRAGSEQQKSTTSNKRKRGYSPCILDARDLEFNIIQEDPSMPKDRVKFINFCPPVKTWSAPFQLDETHPAPMMFSFPVAPSVVPADTTPQPPLNLGMGAPVDNAIRPPHPHRLPFHTGAQLSPNNSDHDQDQHHMPAAAPSPRRVPTCNWGTGARRVRHPPENKAATLPRMPSGVRVIARPGEWNEKGLHTPASPLSRASSEASSSAGSGSVPSSQLQVVDGEPTRPTPEEIMQRTFWNTVL
ncbi:hypothetical protein HYPSUDRAFT_47581 [Hypholoma sublateritium FD-334 SS-4]|uniref:Uncharacterized protein n=1 Tax=Hypholoma sublateritium (strain FD-334 SS-4) TaxID=945553 RepID=A0A0D2P7A1_HYPSF|nr:hypothetical protein HYPSUDRAFT_47581 [Hypholoma sublateritium FD-334 SS-4]